MDGPKYHPLTLCDAQDPRVSPSSYMTALHPNGAIVGTGSNHMDRILFRTPILLGPLGICALNLSMFGLAV